MNSVSALAKTNEASFTKAFQRPLSISNEVKEMSK